MKNRFYLVLAGLLFVLIATSCSKIPQAEIDTAKAAVNEAKAVGADIYIAETYTALEDSLDAILVNIEGKKSKLLGNYSSDKANLESLSLYAAEVKTLAENRKAELITEIQTSLEEVKALLATNNQLILEAPKGKEGTSALKAMKAELVTIEASLAEINEMLVNGDILGSLDKAKTAKANASAINTELTTVIAKYKENVKNRRT